MHGRSRPSLSPSPSLSLGGSKAATSRVPTLFEINLINHTDIDPSGARYLSTRYVELWLDVFRLSLHRAKFTENQRSP